MGRKKGHQEEHENLERWLVSYADFITLLFAFFTVLYALSMQDKVKYKDAVENIQRAFLSAGGMFALKGHPFTPFEKAPDRGSVVPPRPDDLGQFSKMEQEEVVERVAEQIRGIFKQSTGLGLKAGQLEVYKTQSGYRIRLGEYLLFGPGSDKIRRQSIPFLFEVGKRLKRLDRQISIEGHSDSAPLATTEANWQLSLGRAFNVTQFFLVGVQFPHTKISVSGYGDSKPIADNSTSEGRQRNRRVEIVINVEEQTMEKFSWED
jgi:chemotaxis protein MotB